MLSGKVALVTGAARAQGRAHAVTLARHGADIVMLDIGHDVDGVRYPLGTKAELEETARAVEALDRQVVWQLADVRSQDELDAVVAAGLAAFGHIDIAIANAAVFDFGPTWELTEQQSSVNGLEAANGHSHYAAAKHGVIGLMRSLALEAAPLGIRCNAICPGFVRSGMTGFQEQLDRYAGHPGGTEADLEHAGRSYHPPRDLTDLDPQHIAGAALWLASDAAAAVTGVALPVEAGHLLMPGVYTGA
jgi:NAD(P)-dependent dehydrogenase (short-subunit alcohol dehydrogenase family)